MKKILSKIRQYVWKCLGISEIISLQHKTISNTNNIILQNKELNKALVFNNTIIDSEWLKNKSFSPGGWAVDYTFLYTLYRVLDQMKPNNIIEFGLGQSSKMVYQYTNFFNKNAITCEHDIKWIDFFCSVNNKYTINIRQFPLEKIQFNGKSTLSYDGLENAFKGEKFDLFIIDGPFGSDHYSRSQIIPMLQKHLEKKFCIIIDDYERIGERETGYEVINQLEHQNIQNVHTIYQGSKQHLLICSPDLHFLISL